MRADALSNRAAILTAARTLYATRGADVPLSSVARAAGVGIATLYRHFPTQHELELGLLAHVRDQILQTCEFHLPKMRSTPTTAWPRFAADLAVLELGALIPHLTTVDTGNLTPELATGQSLVVEALAAVLAEAKRARLVRKNVTVMQFHVGLGILSRPLPQPSQDSLAEIRAWLLRTYLHGLEPN